MDELSDFYNYKEDNLRNNSNLYIRNNSNQINHQLNFFNSQLDYNIQKNEFSRSNPVQSNTKYNINNNFNEKYQQQFPNFYNIGNNTVFIKQEENEDKEGVCNSKRDDKFHLKL